MKTQKSNFKIVIAAAILAAASILSSCSKTTETPSNPLKTFTITDNEAGFGKMNTLPVTYQNIYFPMSPKWFTSSNPLDEVATVTVNGKSVPCLVNGINFSFKVDGSAVYVFSDQNIDITNDSQFTIVVSLTTSKY